MSDARVVSLGTMITQLAGMLGTNDLTAWEQGFVTSIIASTANGRKTSHLSEAQVDTIDRIYSKHFA